VGLADAPDRDQAAARLLVFVLGGLRAGIVDADPHPDDVRVLEDGRVAILDFGATRAVDPARAAVCAEAVEAFVARDADAFGAALERLGALPAAHAATALELGRAVLAEFAEEGAVRLDSEAIVAGRDRLFRQPDALVELIQAGTMPPEDMWPARGVGQLFATIARVGATGPWRELVAAAIRDGWDALA
jgi:hypothetical protein